MDYSKILDTDHFCSYVGDDPQYQKEMAALFAEQSILYFHDLKLAYQNKSSTQWHDVSHQLKGLAAFTGTFKLQEQCKIAQFNAEASHTEKHTMLASIERELQLAHKAFTDFITSTI